MVDNALRYGSGQVTLGVRRNGTARSRSTSPTGARGSPRMFLDRAFERFSRASSSSRDGGSGLGLAIVQTVARAHGGEAHAANSDRGADVWLALPLRPIGRLSLNF